MSCCYEVCFQFISSTPKKGEFYHFVPIELSFENALYFSTITFTTVGYGDIEPIGINRVIAATEAIVGVALNIAFIGYVLSSRRFFIEKSK